jgi:hypothetical protein
MAYRAMVLQKLNRLDEAAQVLRDAENLFTPELQARSAFFWWGVEHCQLALEEARQLIRFPAK